MPVITGWTAKSGEKPKRAAKASSKTKQRGSVKGKSTKDDGEKKNKENERLKACFREFDADGSGTISRDELEVVMTRLGKLNGREISRLMDEVDKNNDGVIHFDEFVDWMTGHAGSAPEKKFDFEALVRPLFAIWDSNGNGTISFDEFKECHSIMSSALNAAAEKAAVKGTIGGPEQVVKLVAGHEDTVWRAANSNCDSEVTFPEFTSWMRHSVEHSDLGLDRIVELITKQTLLLESILATSGKKSIARSSMQGLVEQLGECSSRLFRRSKTDMDVSKFAVIDPELWQQLPGPDSEEKLIRMNMEEEVPAEGMLKTEACVKSCIPTRNKDSFRLLSMVCRTSIYRRRQGDIPPGQPVREQYFYASDGTEWQSLGKDGSEYFKSVDELPTEMRLYARMHAAAKFKKQISWRSIQEVLQESIEVGLFTKEDQISFNTEMDKEFLVALSRQESIDEISETSERREKAKDLLPEVPFDILEVMAELASLNIIPARPLWDGIKLRVMLP